MILIAPTAFKGTHSASAVARALAAGVPGDAVLMPVSDGGPGLIEALQHAQGGAVQQVSVTGPLGDAVPARILVQAQRAVIESADACGYHLVPEARRDPLLTSTYGVGELIRAAGAWRDDVVVGLGGSATIDAGLGMAQALGWQLVDVRGFAVERGARGLLQLHGIAGAPLPLPQLTGLADVRNPLFGPNGAARVFGPQKGAAPRLVDELDTALERFAGLLAQALGTEVAALAGGGAAGGLGAGLRAFARAELRGGSEWLLRELHFDEALSRADAVITAEGSFDAQSGMGKITGEIVARALARAVPVLLIAGRIEGQPHAGVTAVPGGPALSLRDIGELARAHLPRLLSA